MLSEEIGELQVSIGPSTSITGLAQKGLLLWAEESSSAGSIISPGTGGSGSGGSTGLTDHVPEAVNKNRSGLKTLLKGLEIGKLLTLSSCRGILKDVVLKRLSGGVGGTATSRTATAGTALLALVLLLLKYSGSLLCDRLGHHRTGQALMRSVHMLVGRSARRCAVRHVGLGERVVATDAVEVWSDGEHLRRAEGSELLLGGFCAGHATTKVRHPTKEEL